MIFSLSLSFFILNHLANFYILKTKTKLFINDQTKKAQELFALPLLLYKAKEGNEETSQKPVRINKDARSRHEP